MERRRLLQLWANAELASYIRCQARRHFGVLEDQEDAVDEAWEKIAELPGAPTAADARHCGFRAIVNLYRRESTRRRAEGTYEEPNPSEEGTEG